MPQLDFCMYFNTQFSLFLFFFNLLLCFWLFCLCLFYSAYIYLLSMIDYFIYLCISFLNSLFLFFKSYIILYSNYDTNLVVTNPLSFGFQPPASVEMAVLLCAHNDLYYYLVIIFSLVSWCLFKTIFSRGLTFFNFFVPSELSPCFDFCSFLEIIWTIIPSFFLIAAGYPTVSLLYSIDDHFDSDMILKVIGHQWYWTYEYPIYINSKTGRMLKFDSNLLNPSLFKGDQDILQNSNLRLLEVDNRCVLPIKAKITALITSSDVLHSWAVPSLGFKIDACPGRINQIEFTIDKNGLYRGQCSEFCGVGHGFMPIVIQSVSSGDFVSFLHFKIRFTNLYDNSYNYFLVSYFDGFSNKLNWFFFNELRELPYTLIRFLHFCEFAFFEFSEPADEVSSTSAQTNFDQDGSILEKEDCSGGSCNPDDNSKACKGVNLKTFLRLFKEHLIKTRIPNNCSFSDSLTFKVIDYLNSVLEKQDTACELDVRITFYLLSGVLNSDETLLPVTDDYFSDASYAARKPSERVLSRVFEIEHYKHLYKKTKILDYKVKFESASKKYNKEVYTNAKILNILDSGFSSNVDPKRIETLIAYLHSINCYFYPALNSEPVMANIKQFFHFCRCFSHLNIEEVCNGKYDPTCLDARILNALFENIKRYYFLSHGLNSITELELDFTSPATPEKKALLSHQTYIVEMWTKEWESIRPALNMAEFFARTNFDQDDL